METQKEHLFVYEGSPLDSPYTEPEAITHTDRKDHYRKYLVRKLINRDASLENIFRNLQPDTEIELHGDMPDYYLDVILEIHRTLQEAATYEEALSLFKEKYSLDRIDYDPDRDGVDHINVYSRGRSELGRLLSNFAHTPFDHPEYGHFSSVEAFWYWLLTGMNHDPIRGLYGYQAKKQGRLIRDSLGKQAKLPVVSDFEAKIKKALFCKITQNHSLKEQLRNSTLPLTHYYVWGEKPNIKISYPERYSWIHDYIMDVRDWLNGKAQRLIIAGSRTITDFNLIEEGYAQSGFKAIEIISGRAKGVDRLGEELARKLKLPVALFPADWDQHGKRAGFLRNEEMAQYADAGLLFWDGVSHGTPHMEECLIKAKKPVVMNRLKVPAVVD